MCMWCMYKVCMCVIEKGVDCRVVEATRVARARGVVEATPLHAHRTATMLARIRATCTRAHIIVRATL